MLQKKQLGLNLARVKGKLWNKQRAELLIYFNFVRTIAETQRNGFSQKSKKI